MYTKLFQKGDTIRIQGGTLFLGNTVCKNCKGTSLLNKKCRHYLLSTYKKMFIWNIKCGMIQFLKIFWSKVVFRN